MINVGYLTSSKNKDEAYTPYYAASPIIKYIDPSLVVWCPFDQEWSAYVRLLRENGNKVITSHISNGLDFFNYEPEYYDIIVTNPPFSCKDEVIERLYQLGKPFAILLPLNSLQGRSRYESFKNCIQLLSFDQRIDFHDPTHMDYPNKGTPFASAYFCRDILPDNLILERLEKFDRSLYIEMVKIVQYKIMCKIIK
jgi:hypothetical protein